LPALAEVARVDPEPLVRSEAVRSLAQLPVAADSRIAIVLRDLWSVGDDALRGDIARGLAQTAIWRAGGREALRVLLSSEHGPPIVEGAAAVIRRKDAGEEMLELSLSQLSQAIASGPTSARLQALALAPLDQPKLLAAVKTATQDDDSQVQVGALARLASADLAAKAALEKLAQPASPVGASARAALAGAGDRRVQAWIEQDLVSRQDGVRLGAAAAHADMGVAARAAPLLAAQGATVRLRAACLILMAQRRSRPLM
jgi:hypothetical protein